MSISRKTAVAKLSQLQQQLDASGHESRKVRALRLEAMTKEIDNLTKRLETSEAALDASKSMTQRLIAEVAALKAPKVEA